jgi:hypothetical protein
MKNPPYSQFSSERTKRMQGDRDAKFRAELNHSDLQTKQLTFQNSTHITH